MFSFNQRKFLLSLFKKKYNQSSKQTRERVSKTILFETFFRMKQRLSSILIPLSQIIFVSAAILGIYRLIKDYQSLMILPTPIIYPLFVFAFARTLWWKNVYLKSDSLTVSNYLKTIEIPLLEIDKIRSSSFWGVQPQTITLKLKSKSYFGNKIVYVPRGAGLNAKAFADELRDLIEARSKEQNPPEV